MDFQFWLYIIIVVIYAISRALKKKDPQTGPPPDYKSSDRPVNTPKQAPMSFEDLLREITEAKKPQPNPEPIRPIPVAKREAPKPTYVDYDDDLKDEIEDLEDVDYSYKNQNKTYEIYESAKKEAFARPSLEENSNLKGLEERLGRFKEFETARKSTFLDKYVQELRDKDGFKKAFIMSEILNRKY